MTSVDGPSLPVLDMETFREDPGSPGAGAFVADLARVGHDIGFFYLTGHGVDPALDDGIHGLARRFFALPDADRVAIENVRSPQFRGYTRLGHEYTNGHADLRDQLDIGHELPAARLGPGDPAWLRLRGPNQWPDALPDLRPAVLAWMAALEAVGRTVLHGVALPSASPPTISTPRSDPTPRS